MLFDHVDHIDRIDHIARGGDDSSTQKITAGEPAVNLLCVGVYALYIF
jgi:hypothetical protein